MTNDRSIREIIDSREIREIFHFTTNRGLLGALCSGSLKARSLLTEDDYLEFIFRPNSAIRKDPLWLDHVSLSISRINVQFMGVARRWHVNEGDIWWAILSFTPDILTHQNVVFTTTNNIYSGVRRAKGAAGLLAQFDASIVHWDGNTERRPSNLGAQFPTSFQAEVLYPKEVPTEFLQAIYVSTEEDAADAESFVSACRHRAVPIHVAPEKFQ